MILSNEIQLRRETNQQSGLITAGIVVVLFLIVWFVKWQLPQTIEKDTAFIEVEMAQPLVELPNDPPITPLPPDKTSATADKGNNTNGFGEHNPKVAGTPGEASGDENKDPRTPDTKDLLHNTNGEHSMPVNGNNPRATRLPNGTVTPPTGNTTQGQAPRRPRATLGSLNGRGDGTGGNGDINNGFSGEGNRPGGGDAGRPDGIAGSRGSDLGSGGSISITDDVEEDGSATFRAIFNKSGQCINVERLGGTVTNARQVNRAKAEIRKEHVPANPDGPAERFKKYLVKFKREG